MAVGVNVLLSPFLPVKIAHFSAFKHLDVGKQMKELNLLRLSSFLTNQSI